ncbi:MAG TPA: hypothetical protein VI306_09090 [Pyrinomonadaceae bacterium]
MKLVQTTSRVLIVLAMFTTLVTAADQLPNVPASALKDQKPTTQTPSTRTPIVRRKRHLSRRVIPPVTVLHNPEYISGEASVSVAANSNPLIRIGIAQNGVTLIEFPAADRFFAVHAGNSDLVTVEKSPSLKRDHHLVLRAGSGFLITRTKGMAPILPGTSIIAQMDSGMAITFMIYPVPLLKEQAHRLVISYNREEVISARKIAGLATDLVGSDGNSQASPPMEVTENPMLDLPVETILSPTETNPNFTLLTKTAVAEAVANPKLFTNWTKPKYSLSIATTPPRELSETERIVSFAVRNTGAEPLRLIAGYPDLYVETLNADRKPVEAGTKVKSFCSASSSPNNVVAPGATIYFTLAYEAPILGVRQHLKVVVAHMNAADEPATADLTRAIK